MDNIHSSKLFGKLFKATLLLSLISGLSLFYTNTSGQTENVLTNSPEKLLVQKVQAESQEVVNDKSIFLGAEKVLGENTIADASCSINRAEDMKIIGSGIMVRNNGKHAVITAGHVVDDLSINDFTMVCNDEIYQPKEIFLIPSFKKKNCSSNSTDCIDSDIAVISFVIKTNASKVIYASHVPTSNNFAKGISRNELIEIFGFSSKYFYKTNSYDTTDESKLARKLDVKSIGYEEDKDLKVEGKKIVPNDLVQIIEDFNNKVSNDNQSTYLKLLDKTNESCNQLVDKYSVSESGYTNPYNFIQVDKDKVEAITKFCSSSVEVFSKDTVTKENKLNLKILNEYLRENALPAMSGSGAYINDQLIGLVSMTSNFHSELDIPGYTIIELFDNEEIEWIKAVIEKEGV